MTETEAAVVVSEVETLPLTTPIPILALVTASQDIVATPNNYQNSAIVDFWTLV